MAVIKAQASGNWSDSGTWSGGVVPSLNDTVYANGFTVTLDQSIDLTGSTVDTSGSFIPGQIYQIVSLGTTNYTLTANCIAPGSNAGTAVAVANTVGTYFQAVNAGTATTGTARRVGALLTFVNTPLTIATGGGFALSSNYNVTGAYIMAGSTAALTVSGTASTTLTGCRSVGSAFTGSTRSILFSSSGTLSGVGLIIAGGNASGAYGLGNTGSGTVDLTSSSAINGGTFNSDSWAILNSSNGIISVNSGFLSPSSVAGAIKNSGAGQIICNNVISGPGYQEAIRNDGATASVTYTGGTITGGNSGGISNITGSVSIISATINGNSYASSTHGISNNGSGLVSTNTCTINAGGAVGGGYGIYNATTGNLVLTNSPINANGVAGVFNNSTGSITSSGDIVASSSAVGLSSTNAAAVVILSGSFISALNGTSAIFCPKYRVSPTPLLAKTRYAKDGISQYVDMFTADNNLGQANPTDVRSGVSYASGNLTGRLTVPARGSVSNSLAYGPSMPFTATRSGTTATATLAYSYPYQVGDVITVTGASNPEWNGSYTIASVVSGTSVTFTVPDTYSATAGAGALMQTTGTAILTADAVWNTLASSMTTSGSIGERLKNCATTQSTGDQLASLL